MQTKSHIYFLLIWIILIISVLFTVIDSFVDEVILPKWLALYFILLLGGLLFLPLFRNYPEQIKWISIYRRICGGTNIFILIESLLALTQKFALIKNDTCLIGSFDSITGLISALCLNLPMGFLFFQRFSIPQKTIFLIGKAITCFTIAVYESRTGIICITLTLFYLIYCNKGVKKIKLALFLASIIFVCTFCFKIPSTKGRWFIIERSLEMIKEHPFLGWGSNGFKENYMNIQAEFFSFHPESNNVLLADNIHHPINEFIQIAVDYGIPLLVLVCFFLFTAIIHSVRFKRPSSLEGSCILATLSIWAFFSYPFSYPFTWVMLVLSLILIYSNTLNQFLQNKNIFILMRFAILILVIFCVKPLVTEIAKQTQWKTISRLSLTNYPKGTDIIKMYEELYPHFSNNYNFLYDYACVAYDNKKYEKALKLAQEAKKHIADYDVEMLIADTYNSMHNNHKALSVYWHAHNMCPSRIAPYYESYKIYRNQNDTIRCLELYAMMKKRGVKVKNVLTESMFYEVEKDIKQLQ